MTSARCRNCSAQLTSTDHFCPDCGNPVSTAMPLFAGPEAGTLLSTPPHSASARRRVAFWVSFGIAAAIAAIAGILTWQLIDAVAISNAVTTSPSGIAAGSGSPEASSPVAPEPKATEVIAAIENPTVEPVVAATEDANAGQYPPDDLNPPSYEATAEPTIDPTEEADLPYEIADPIDNLTATPTPGPYPEEGENPDLPTEIDVPIDNLTPTPTPGLYPEEGEDPNLPSEIDVPVDNLPDTPITDIFPEEGEDYSLPTEIDVPVDNLPDTEIPAS